MRWDYMQRETWRMGPYAGVDYNLTLCDTRVGSSAFDIF
jgi:hypothetical protein